MQPNHSHAYLRCIERDCVETFPIDTRIITCRQCAGLLDVQYDFNLSNTADEMKAIFKERRAAHPELERSGVW